MTSNFGMYELNKIRKKIYKLTWRKKKSKFRAPASRAKKPYENQPVLLTENLSM